jgi:hypothetical protein
LPADVLPSNTRFISTVTCVLSGQVFSGYDPARNRDAAPVPADAYKEKKPPLRDLRSISFGMLGAHAVSITVRTDSGLQTRPVSRGTGAYLIVEPSKGSTDPYDPTSAYIGYPAISAFIGYPAEHEPHAWPLGALSAITYRFGSLTCSVGSGSPVSRPCPEPKPRIARNWMSPTHSLNEQVHVHLLVQAADVCAREFLITPCYRAELEFRAPYAISDAGSEYDVQAGGRCKGGRPNSWGTNNDVKRGALLHILSTGYFSCTSDHFVVQYMNMFGPRPRSPHESVIVGTVSLNKPQRH